MSDFVTISTPDGRQVRLPKGMTRQEMASALNSLPPNVDAAQAQPTRTVGQTIYENVIGSGDVDTPGERFGQAMQEAGRAGAAGISRGVTGLMDLPGKMVSGAGALAERGLVSAGVPGGVASEVRRNLQALPFGSGSTAAQAASGVTGGASEYKSDTTFGKIAGTVGEFLPGAVLTGGLSAFNLVRFGAIPGVASEMAGQATEGTIVEPYARAVAGIAAPIAAQGLSNLMRTAVSPYGGADPARLALAKLLDDADIPVTAGQRVDSRGLRMAESSTRRGEAIAAQQGDAFTSAALRTAGVTAEKATPDVLDDAFRSLGQTFDDVVAGVDVPVRPQDATRLSEAVATYRELAPASEAAPIFRTILQRVSSNFRTGDTIDARTLATWRSNLSKLRTSNSVATREAAVDALETVDDMISAQLTAMGRGSDVQRLTEARGNYRNLLAIQGAASRAGAGDGVITPAALRSEVVRQGKSAYARGNRGEIGELARAADVVMTPLPAVTPGGVRSIDMLPGLSLGAAGGALGSSVGGPFGAVVGSVAGYSTPMIVNALRSSRAGQSYLANQALGPGGAVLDPRLIGVAAGSTSGNNVLQSPPPSGQNALRQ